MSEKDLLDIIEGAYKDEVIEIVFDIGGGIKVQMTMADSMDMYKERGRLYDNARDVYIEKGYDQRPIDEKEWKRYLELFKDEPERLKEIEEGKPENLAEQKADEDTRMTLLRDLVPKYLRRKDNGELLCPNEPEQKRLGRLIMDSPRLQQLIINKIVEFNRKVAELREQAKNSSKQEKQPTGR